MHEKPQHNNNNNKSSIEGISKSTDSKKCLPDIPSASAATVQTEVELRVFEKIMEKLQKGSGLDKNEIFSRVLNDNNYDDLLNEI